MFRKIIKGLKDVWCGTLEFDTEPKKGSFNPVTSDGVYAAINGAGVAKEIVYFEVDPSDPPSGIYAAITEALSKGKEPVIRNDGTVYFYSSTGTDKYVFVGGYTKEAVGYTEIEVSDDDSVTSKPVDDKVFNMYLLDSTDPASPGDPPGTEDYWICDENKHVITKAELLAAHADCRYFILNNAIEPSSNSRKYFAAVTILSNSYIRLQFYMTQSDDGSVAEFVEKTVSEDSEGRLYISSSYEIYLAGKNQAVLVSEPQSFDSTQKAQGRDNIGAASASDVTALQSQVSSLSDVSAYSVKGEATVAQLNAGPSGIQAGWAYQLTDSGTLTDGSLAVVAGDTVAWDGTKWFPLVKSDYYATKTYAQNVAHSIAPEFDPTRTSENPYLQKQFCSKDGNVYRFTSNHYGPWDDSDVELILGLTGKVMKINGAVSATAPYDDLNTFPANEVVNNFSTYANVSNKPSDEPFICITMSNSTTGVSRLQYFFGSSNKLFFRTRYGSSSWSSWIEIGSGIICRGTVSVTSPYNDLNTFPNNEVVLVTTGYSDVANKPTNEKFTVVTISNNSTSTVATQILTTESRTIYVRSKFGGIAWSNWVKIGVANTIHGVGNQSAVAPYDNLNTFPNNEVVLINNFSAVSNRPVDEGFAAITISNSDTSTVKLQLLSSQSNKVYVRSCYAGAWGSWSLVNRNPCIECLGSVSATAPYNNINTFPNNEVVLINNFSAVSNRPIDEAFNVVTISNSKSSTAKFQILSTQTNKMYVRSAFGALGYNRWTRIDGYAGNPLIGVFDNMLFIGDSLTYSQVFVDDIPAHARLAKSPYPECFAYLCKSTATIMAVSGYTAKQWWDRFANEIPTLTNALAIVYLGTNSGLTDTLDTDAPADQPSSSWDDTTNTGCYAKIIDKLKTMGYKILLIKPWVTGGNIDDTKKVVVEVAERFGCCKVDAPVNPAKKYHSYPDGSGQNTVHFNDLGYSWFASALVNALATIPETDNDNSLKYIIPD